MYVSVLYRGKAYNINNAIWSDKPGHCGCSELNCTLRDIKDGSICRNTLISHCCKHVIHGSETERAKFSDSTGKLKNKEVVIPIQIADDKADIISDYEALSKEVIHTTESVCLSGDGKKVRVVCSGAKETEGFTDFLGFSFDKKSKCGSLDIISSFVNNYDVGTFSLYRLVHQKYCEGFDQGKNVCPLPIYRGDYWVENSLVKPSHVDEAFRRGGLLYDSHDNPNHSQGIIFYYFWNKTWDKWYSMYSKVSELCTVKENAYSLIWSNNPLVQRKRLLFKEYENIYSARMILEYMMQRADLGFKPENYCLIPMDLDLGRLTLPSFADVLSDKRGVNYSDSQKQLYELAFQKAHLERVRDRIQSQYTEMSVSKMAEILYANEKNDGNIGSVADHMSFSIVCGLFNYFIAVNAFADNYGKLYCDKHKHDSYVQSELDQWFNIFDMCKRNFKGALFSNWLRVMDDLFKWDREMEAMKAKWCR